MRHTQAASPLASLSEISDALRPFLISSSAVCPGLDPKGFSKEAKPVQVMVKGRA